MAADLPPYMWQATQQVIQRQPQQQQAIPTDLVPEKQINSLSPYTKTEEGRSKFTQDMYEMGVNLGLSPEAAKAFVAQKALESTWGTELAAPFNFGGIKARKGEASKITTTKEDYGKGKITTKQAFQAFENNAGYQNRMSELLNLNRYKSAKNAQTFEDYVKGMVSGGYATDKEYLNKILQMKKSVEKRLTKPTYLP